MVEYSGIAQIVGNGKEQFFQLFFVQYHAAAQLLLGFYGFFYKIFLSRVIGAEGMGIYQLVFPVYAFAFSLSAAEMQTIADNIRKAFEA